MHPHIKEKLENIVINIVMIPIIPVIFVVGAGMYLIDKFFLTDEDRYQLGKK